MMLSQRKQTWYPAKQSKLSRCSEQLSKTHCPSVTYGVRVRSTAYLTPAHSATSLDTLVPYVWPLEATPSLRVNQSPTRPHIVTLQRWVNFPETLPTRAKSTSTFAVPAVLGLVRIMTPTPSRKGKKARTMTNLMNKQKARAHVLTSLHVDPQCVPHQKRPSHPWLVRPRPTPRPMAPDYVVTSRSGVIAFIVPRKR